MNDFDAYLYKLVDAALNEDVGNGDHSTLCCIPADVKGKAVLKIKQDGVLAGVDVAEKIFKYKKLAFSAAASPLVFRSYLTLIYPEGKEMHLDHHFYVSEVWQTWSGSGFANSGYAQNGNIFSL